VNAPDLFDAEGRPIPERRHERRREEDVDPELFVGYEAFVRFMVAKRLRFGAIVGFVCTAGGYTVAAIGAPREVVKLRAEVHSSDSVRDIRVARIEGSIQVGEGRLQRLENSDTFKMYLLCVLVRRTDPNATPPECGAIIQQGGKP
jgi:hypothetical protein